MQMNNVGDGAKTVVKTIVDTGSTATIQTVGIFGRIVAFLTSPENSK